MNNFMLYAILILIVLLLIEFHNVLIGKKQDNPFKRSDIELTLKEQLALYFSFFSSTLLLMLIATLLTLPFKLEGVLDGLVAIGMISITSFFLIQTFNPLLGLMKEEKLSFKLLKNHNFLLTIYLIIVTELSFLNWLKEITTDPQPFLIFVTLYAILITVLGGFLGIPKQNGDGKIVPKLLAGFLGIPKQQNGDSRIDPKLWPWRSLILIDPLIVVLFTSILVKLILDIISLIQ